MSISVRVVIRWVGSRVCSYFPPSHIGALGFPLFSPSNNPSNHPSSFSSDLTLPKLLEQTQIGTHLTTARNIQVRPLETLTSRNRCHPLVHGVRSYFPPRGPQRVADADVFEWEEVAEGRGIRIRRRVRVRMLGYGSVGWGRYLAQQQQGVGARTYALQSHFVDCA